MPTPEQEKEDLCDKVRGGGRSQSAADVEALEVALHLPDCIRVRNVSAVSCMSAELKLMVSLISLHGPSVNLF